MEEKNSNTKPMKELQQTLLNEDTIQEAIKAHKQIVLLSDPEDAKEAQELYPGLFFTAPLTDDGLADEDLPDALEGAKVIILHSDKEEQETLQSVYQLCADLTGRAEEVKSLPYGESFSSFLEGYRKDPSKITSFLQNAIPYKTFKEVQKQAEAYEIKITERIGTKEFMTMANPASWMNEKLPEVNFLVDNFLTDEVGISVFTAPSKTGKTIILQNLAVCLSSGKEFAPFKEEENNDEVSEYDHSLNHLKVPKKKKVLFVSLENPDNTLKRRFKKIREALGVTNPADMPYVIYINEFKKRYGSDFNVLLKAIQGMIKKGKFDVLILEPLYLIGDTGTGNENSTEDAQKVIDILRDKLAFKYNIKVIVAAHTKKGHNNNNTRSTEAIAGTGKYGRFGDDYIEIEENENHRKGGRTYLNMKVEVREIKDGYLPPKDRVITFGSDLLVRTDINGNPYKALFSGSNNKDTSTNPKGAGRPENEKLTHEKALEALFKAMEYVDFEPVKMLNWNDYFAGGQSIDTLKSRRKDLDLCVKTVGKDKYCFNFEAIGDPDLHPGWKKTLAEIKSKIPKNKLDKAQGTTEEKKAE